MRIIRGKYGRRRFDVPGNITARPTTDFARENIFNIIENTIDIEGCRALDLFGGTGAISLELLSRGAASVTCVEKASTQFRFIAKVAEQLGERNLRLIRGDVFRYLASAPKDSFDFVFADPPYDMERFDEVPRLVLESGILRPGALFIIEHSRARDFSSLPHFLDHRTYGSVNFSLFLIPDNHD
ncbi:MAG: 16S rRNA (guanine(966)-N(2))-methyltransferase RsmD [Bacteroides sp.]|nr:16S rRNA (guanine(966)-N(2))-methyltransferase RsmD [Bacteroides sp.]MCM1413015.1 16S rRNA (guanine(966)-N(2))-methyltransferase RsmD [Bacteroides sp.]MCM1471721.1 16S rRNA (guanine(966)-N(2))-methyltransferase RsmD [Bacteroides sp.]